MKKSLLVIMVGVMLLSGCKPTTATQACTEEFNNQSSTAKEYVKTILNGDYDTATTYSHNDEMKKLISDEKYIESIEPHLSDLGTLKEIGTPLCESTEDGLVVSLPMKFSNQNVNINILFDSNSAIAGVSFSQYSGQ